MNDFLNQLGQKNTTTWNNAVSNSTSGVSTLDYFAKCGSYRGRKTVEVNADMGAIFGHDPLEAMQIVFYNRMITRKTKGFNNTCESVQRGQGQKDEFIKSLVWLENNYPDTLYKNLWLVPMVGSWKDLWYDSAATSVYHYINAEKVYELVKVGMQSEYQRALIAKYLPKIRSRRNIKNDRHRRMNIWARGLCDYLGWTEAEYRRFKSNPENSAHAFQRIMCAKEWDSLDFNTVSGKALFNLLSQKGKDQKNVIERHGLDDKYLEWIKSQPVAKFTGYPYELFMAAKAGRNAMQTYTYDAQFAGLLDKAKDSVSPELLKKGVLCALDTSGSMGYMGSYGCFSAPATPQPIDICVGLGLYFSSLLDGYFHNHVIMFDDQSHFLKLSGESFCNKADQIAKSSTAWGGTNFQSVIDEIVRVRRLNPDIPLEDFPEVLLVVSDMQFNPAGSTSTNYEQAMRKLRAVGLPDMTIIWWQVNGRHTGDVPSTNFDPGTVLISGFDGAIITTILGGMEEVVDEKTGEKRKATPEEMMKKALDQEVLQRIEI